MPFWAVLSRRQWALPILAALADGTAARLAPLAAATGAGRASVRVTLQHLAELELIERNPGHGHPLRPEWRITPRGSALVPIAKLTLRGRRPEDPVPTVIRRQWGLAIVDHLTLPSGFSGLRRALLPITDRALSLTLKDLEAEQLVRREIEGRHHPPRALYRRDRRARALGRAIDRYRETA